MQLSRLHFTALQELNNHIELASSSRFHNTLTPCLIISNQHLNTSFSKVSFSFCKYFHRKPDARLSLLSPGKSREAICKVYQKTAGQSIAHSPFQLQEVCHGQKVVGTHTGIQQNKKQPFSLPLLHSKAADLIRYNPLTLLPDSPRTPPKLAPLYFSTGMATPLLPFSLHTKTPASFCLTQTPTTMFFLFAGTLQMFCTVFQKHYYVVLHITPPEKL